jgi:hypothetical protein
MEIDQITKPELIALYHKCDDHLHDGRYESLPQRHKENPNFRTVENALPKIVRLLDFHRITLMAPDEELWVWMKWDEDKVRAELIASR